jgi:hypothetical protein
MNAKKRAQKIVSLICVALSIFASQAVSQPASPQVQGKLRQVSLFKNGLGFFIMDVSIPAKQDSFTVVMPATPSHGSFWVSYPSDAKLDSILVKEAELTEQADAITLSELLKANVGRKVKLTYSTGDSDKILTGIIRYFAENRQPISPSPYEAGGIATRESISIGLDYSSAALMIVETEAGEVGVNPQIFKGIEFLDGKAQKTFSNKRKSIQLDVRLGAPVDGKKLTVSYLAKGATWAPSYIVDISDTDKARISAKAELMNEVCDLNDVEVQLITGFPHIQFSDTVSPMAMKENLAQFLQSLDRGQSQRGRTGQQSVVTQQSLAFNISDYYESTAAMPAYSAVELGKMAGDLFFYSAGNVKMKKAEVCYLPLFTESVPYKHIYTWDIPDYTGGAPRNTIEPVWHCVRLENTAKSPWTTAPAETMEKDLVLGQDTLNYTPVGAKSTLRITQAVNVKADEEELETERQRNAANFYGSNYDLVTVQGKLSITNLQNKAITLEVTKTISGTDVKSSKPDAKVEKLAKGLRSVNSTIKLGWTIELKPNESQQINYTYNVYVCP